MVRKSFQLAIAAEQEHFENKSSLAKKTYLAEHLKKNYIMIWEISGILSAFPLLQRAGAWLGGKAAGGGGGSVCA